MIIPDTERQLAIINAMATQYDNGYEITDADYVALSEAVTHITYMYNKISEQRRKEGKTIIKNGVTPF